MKPTFTPTRSTYAHTLGLACRMTLSLALGLIGSNLAAQTSASATNAASASASAKSVPLDQVPPLEVEEGPNTLKKPDANNKPLPSTRDNSTTLKQSSAQGKATQVEVKKGKNTYYVKSNEPKGSALRGDAQSNPIGGTQWKIMEFNSKQKKPNPAPAAPVATSAPAAAAHAVTPVTQGAASASAPPPDNSLALPPVLETK